MHLNILGYSGFDRREDDTFTFFNPNIFPIEIGILGDDWVDTAVPALVPIDTTIITDVENFLNYEELVRDKRINPKRIKGIRLLTDNISQLDRVQNWQSRDANGELASIVDYPIHMLSPMQFQSGVVDIPFDKLLVGLNQFMIYELLPLTSVTMTFVYDDFRIERLLPHG